MLLCPSTVTFAILNNSIYDNSIYVDCTFSYLPYSETNSFSKLVIDYLETPEQLAQFINYPPDKKGVELAIKERSKFSVERATLVATLQKQYTGVEHEQIVAENIKSLASEHTYTVCTAHQPNLLTGYLYFIYKIVHAIKLADELNKEHPEQHFVPVYYMGSEDNDLDELGVFKYNGAAFRWDADGQTGAVGRMKTDTLKPLLNELFKVLGPPSKHTDELKEVLTEAYIKQKDITTATQYLVNALFGKYGLIVLNPDEPSLKEAIIPIIEDDLVNHNALQLVSKEINELEKSGYKSQAHPRDINIFYLTYTLRERIEKQGGKWVVLNSNISWTKEELLEELRQHPERFSPNVILRGIFQETILPNVAFIGGGAEVAYWMQLKTTFDHYETFYPTILPRQSALWIENEYAILRKKLGLKIDDLFTPIDHLIKNYVTKHSNNNWETNEEKEVFATTISSLKAKAIALDPTLKDAAEASLTKINKQLDKLQQKMLRAEKRKMETDIQRIRKLKEALFPNNSLQERKENFISYYPKYGAEYIAQLYEATQPYSGNFVIVENED